MKIKHFLLALVVTIVGTMQTQAYTLYYYNTANYRYAVWSWADGVASEWSGWMTPVSGHTGWYQTTIRDNCNKVIFASFAQQYPTTPNWNAAKGQTGDLTYDGVNAYYRHISDFNQSWYSDFSIFSGTCDNNLKWGLDDNGTLIISGKGDLTSNPWKSDYSSRVKNVIISDGVTSIGNLIFSGCSSLTSITIPNSVTSIGNYAFTGCSSLTSITIPNNVTSIGEEAFSGCRSLTSITIPNSVTDIGVGAFYGCSGLTTVTIPNSVTSIGNQAFYNCSNLTSVMIDSNHFMSKSHYSLSGINWIYGVGHHVFGLQVKEYIIGNNVKNIGKYAFADCDSLTSVIFGNNVASIGEYAFNFCSGLTSITIPNSVTSIGDYAFRGCGRLTSVTIPNSVTNFGVAPFYRCSRLPIIDNIRYADTYLVEAVDKSLSTYNIKQNTKWIGTEAFSGCSNLTSITIPNSVTGIQGGAFWKCTGLTSVTIGNSVTTIISFAFSDCSSLTSVTIPNSVTTIGESAFQGCSNMRLVVIGSCAKTLGVAAFSGCSSLTSVTIPNSVTDICSDAFYKCSGLASVIIGNSVTSIGEEAFSGCSSLTSITIPNSVTGIGVGAFEDCSSLTSVTIPNSVTTIEESTFNGCSSLTSIAIPNEVKYIGRWAFYNCSSLTSITIPNKVTSIGYRAFVGCDSLKEVTIESATPCSLEENVFEGIYPIYVPCGYMDVYKQAWKDYADRIHYRERTAIITAKDVEHGYVKVPETGCDELQVTAIPDYGYHFVKWSDGNTDNPRIVPDIPAEYTAEFAGDTEGKCGDNLSWTISGDTLIIKGDGDMFNFDSNGGPWIASADKISIIILPQGIISIRDYAFSSCSNIKTIICYSMLPPSVAGTSFGKLSDTTVVYVHAGNISQYQKHQFWGQYDVRPIGAMSIQTDNLQVTPQDNAAEVVWPSVSGAATYEMIVKNEQGNVVCSLIFNDKGQLTQIAFHAPAFGKVPQQTEADGFAFLVTGLDSGSRYDLTITAKDNAGTTLNTFTQEFVTLGATGLDNVVMNENTSLNNARKVYEDGRVFLILPNGTKYNMLGTRVE